MKRRLIAITAFLAVMLAGCGQIEEPTTSANNDKDNQVAAQIEVQTEVITETTATTMETTSAEKNTTGQERTATLTIQGGSAPSKSVVITQGKGSDDPVVRTLSSNTTSLNFEAKAESKSFTISSNTNWMISKPDWCMVSVSSGTGNADVIVTAAENPDKDQRSGQIVISGEGVSSVTIGVSQKGKDTTNSQEPGPGDNLPPS